MLLLQRGQCRVRVSGLDIAHYTNCKPDSKLFGSNGIRVWLEFSKYIHNIFEVPLGQPDMFFLKQLARF